MTPPIILLVEDEVLIQMEVETSLQDAGFEVAVASRGMEALALIDAEPDRFKALVTDIRLGDGPNGWDVARHAREVCPTLPVVYVTGDSAGEWHSQGVPDSVVITKPFVMAQLLIAVANLLNQTAALPPPAS